MSLRRAALGLAASLVACAPPPPPPAVPAPPVVPAAATAPAPPWPEPPAARPAARAPLPRAEPITESLPPLDRRFATVTLPGVKGALISVDGRGDRDIWFMSNQERPGRLNKYMTESGVPVHFDGKKVIEQLTPDCYGGMFTSVSVQGQGIVIQGTNPYVRAPMWEIAERPEGKGAKWSCANSYADIHTSRGGGRWGLACWSPDGRSCQLRGDGGARVPFPQHHASFGAEGAYTPLRPAAWEMRGPADGFMLLPDEEGRLALLRYNGVAWVNVASLDDLQISALWIDDEGRVWLPAPGALLRFDGRSLVAIPVAPGFAPGVVAGRSGRDLWFFSPGKVVHHWDGQRFQQGETPFEVGGAWVAPGGEVWIVGQGSAEAANTPPGLVGHAPGVAEVR